MPHPTTPSGRREILFNAFDMNCVVHQSPGLWRHPEDRAREYNTIGYWTHIAQTLEKGFFDGLFIADVLGPYDVFGANPDAPCAPGRRSRCRTLPAGQRDGRRHREPGLRHHRRHRL